MSSFSEREGITTNSISVIYDDAPSYLRLAYIKQILKPILDRTAEIGPSSSDEMTDIDSYYLHFACKNLCTKLCIDLCFNPANSFFGIQNQKDSIYYNYIFKTIQEVEWYRFYDVVEYIGKQFLEVETYCEYYWKKEEDFIKFQIEECGITEEELLDYDADDADYKEEKEYRKKEFINEVNFDTYRSQLNNLFINFHIGWKMNDEGILIRELPIELKEKIDDIQSNMKGNFPAAHEHYKKALSFITQRPLDPANSIKEIITALESLGRTLYPKARNLTGVVMEMRKNDTFPQKLLDVMQKFYEYASDDPGIRHGKPEIPNVTLDDAEFCLHLGAALINYIELRNKPTDE